MEKSAEYRSSPAQILRLRKKYKHLIAHRRQSDALSNSARREQINYIGKGIMGE